MQIFFNLEFNTVNFNFPLFKQISKNSSMDEHGSSTKKKQVSSLPSIKMVENSSLGTAKREDFSSAKQKRASFHSGANRAFLDPIRSATEVKWSSISEKNSFQKSSAGIVERNFLKGTIEDKEDDTEEKNTWREDCPCDSITNEKAATIERIADKSNCDKNAQIKTISIENRENDLQDDKTITPRETDRSDSTRKISSPSITVENKDSDLSTIDKTSFSRSSEARSNTMNDKNPSSIKKPVESQKIDQKSRRTNSAPPQRRFESISANNNNRVHVNVVIDSMRKNRNQKDQDMDCRYNAMEKIDTAVTKVHRSLLE